MGILLPELAASDLVLWRLRHTTAYELWCAVSDLRGELALMVYNPATDQTSLAEPHCHIVSLTDRAEALRQDLVAAGWRRAEDDPNDPD